MMWPSRSGHGSWEPEAETGEGVGKDILLSPTRLALLANVPTTFSGTVQRK